MWEGDDYMIIWLYHISYVQVDEGRRWYMIIYHIIFLMFRSMRGGEEEQPRSISRHNIISNIVYHSYHIWFMVSCLSFAIIFSRLGSLPLAGSNNALSSVLHIHVSNIHNIHNIRTYTCTWAEQYHIPQCHTYHVKHSWYKSIVTASLGGGGVGAT